jgi:hypothetical protein
MRRKQLSGSFVSFYPLLGDAYGSPGSSAALLACPQCCVNGKPKMAIVDGTTACCTRGKLPVDERPIQALLGMKTKLVSTQHLLPDLQQRESVRFALHAKSAADAGLKMRLTS